MNDKMPTRHHFLCVLEWSFGYEVNVSGMIPWILSVMLLVSLQYTFLSCIKREGWGVVEVGIREKGSTWLNFYAVFKREPEDTMWSRLNLGIWLFLNCKGGQIALEGVKVVSWLDVKQMSLAMWRNLGWC